MKQARKQTQSVLAGAASSRFTSSSSSVICYIHKYMRMWWDENLDDAASANTHSSHLDSERRRIRQVQISITFLLLLITLVILICFHLITVLSLSLSLSMCVCVCVFAHGFHLANLQKLGWIGPNIWSAADHTDVVCT